MNITNKKILIFVIVGLLILVSAKYVSFNKLKYWTIGLLESENPVLVSEKNIDLDFETSTRSVCKISGTVFIKAKDWSMQKTNDATFHYRNIDTQARVIYWKFSPEDEIKGGPNMFAQLEVPDGEYFPVKFFFKDKPKHKEYTVKATITYGDLIDGKIESGKRDCKGEIKIIIDEGWK